MSGERFDYRNERQRHEKFVGREALLARLDELLVDDGVDRWVVLTGGPGMGKSAILSAWLARREAASVTSRRASSPRSARGSRRADLTGAGAARRAPRSGRVASIRLAGARFVAGRPPADRRSRGSATSGPCPRVLSSRGTGSRSRTDPRAMCAPDLFD